MTSKHLGPVEIGICHHPQWCQAIFQVGQKTLFCLDVTSKYTSCKSRQNAAVDKPSMHQVVSTTVGNLGPNTATATAEHLVTLLAKRTPQH